MRIYPEFEYKKVVISFLPATENDADLESHEILTNF